MYVWNLWLLVKSAYQFCVLQCTNLCLNGKYKKSAVDWTAWFSHTKPKPWANSNNLIPVAPVLLSFSSNFIGMWRALRCSFLLVSDSILKRVYSNWFRADITLFQWVPCHLELSDLHQEIALMRKTVLFLRRPENRTVPWSLHYTINRLNLRIKQLYKKV